MDDWESSSSMAEEAFYGELKEKEIGFMVLIRAINSFIFRDCSYKLSTSTAKCCLTKDGTNYEE